VCVRRDECLSIVSVSNYGVIRKKMGVDFLMQDRSDYTLYSHYGKQAVCRAPWGHRKGPKTHGKVFAVRFWSGRTAKSTR
jgi:hypothetical protein